MANVQNPRGFIPVQPILRTHYYTKTIAAAIYPGDAVGMTSAGLVGVVTTTGVNMIGVALGYVAASGNKVLVSDDPDQQYYIQDDGIAATLAQTSVGNNFAITVTAGTTTWFKSKHSLDTSTATTATTALRLLGFHPDDTIAKYVRCRVVVNNHFFAKKLTGV